MTLRRETLELIRTALAEDVGAGDWTTAWTVPAGTRARAGIFAKAEVALSGAEVARAVFQEVDPTLQVELHVGDGDVVPTGTEVMTIRGALHGILSAERTALNFLGRLSGVATLTRRFADRVEGTGARVIDTRKTTPGFRHLEKAAVVHGGGANHRIGLWDMVLIKENHIAGAGGVARALAAVAKANTRGIPVEIEVRNLEEFEEALGGPLPDRIMLDNLPPAVLRTAVARARELGDARPELEASGNVRLETIREIAETGVDYISVGALTHSAPVADLSLRVVRSEAPR